MSLLDHVLMAAPTEWHNAGTSIYKLNGYALFDVDETTSEYKQTKIEFQSSYSIATVSKIERIQNPFAFARYHLHKEHLQRTSIVSVREKKLYFETTDRDSLNVVLKYNYERQRGNVTLPQTNFVEYYYVIVFQSLSSVESLHYLQRDTDIYPQYVITVKGDKDQKSSLALKSSLQELSI